MINSHKRVVTGEDSKGNSIIEQRIISGAIDQNKSADQLLSY